MRSNYEVIGIFSNEGFGVELCSIVEVVDGCRVSCDCGRELVLLHHVASPPLSRRPHSTLATPYIIDVSIQLNFLFSATNKPSNIMPEPMYFRGYPALLSSNCTSNPRIDWPSGTLAA
jgi:hypothetical protein